MSIYRLRWAIGSWIMYRGLRIAPRCRGRQLILEHIGDALAEWEHEINAEGE